MIHWKSPVEISEDLWKFFTGHGLLTSGLFNLNIPKIASAVLCLFCFTELNLILTDIDGQ